MGRNGWNARGASVLAMFFALGALASAATQGPFEPGERWHHAPPPAAPHLPQTLVAGGDGEWFAAGVGLTHAGLALFGGQTEGGAGLVASDPWCAGASGPVQVATRADRVLSVAQFPLGGGLRRTELAVHAIGGASASFAALARHVVGPPTGGRAFVAAGTGETALVALHDPSAKVIHLSFRRAGDGAVLSERTIAATALRALTCDASGGRFAIAAGDRVYVVGADGGIVFDAALDFASDALAIAGDGRTIAIGAQGRVRLWREGTAGFALLDGPVGAALELPSALALDHAGSWLAVGWWDASSGQAVRMETHDLVLGARVHVLARGPSASGKQDLVTAACVTADARRTAFASWGQGGSEPEVVLFDRHESAPLFVADLPGSALALALDRTGTRIAVAHKAVHANEFAGSGSVRLFDTGERDVELSTSLVGGTTSDVLVRAPGAAFALLLVGPRAGAPLSLAGFTGALAIDPAGWWLALPTAPDGPDRFRASLAIPMVARPVGIHVTLQGLVFDGAWHFSAAAPHLPLL